MAQKQNRESTFGRSLMKYIGSRIPYSNVDSMQAVNEINPKYKLFYNTGSDRDRLLTKHSISRNITDDDHPNGMMSVDKNYHQFMYSNVDHDKGKRLRDYRIMSMYSEVADALDEICDDFIVPDENGHIINMDFHNKDFNQIQRTELEKEFRRFINYFDLENKGWEYLRQLLVDGELYFEHIIHDDHKQKGILGIVSVPTELMDPVYDNVQNMITRGYLLRRPIINPKTGTTEKVEYIPFDRNQITYINSGTWNEDRTVRMPFIENARRAYRQLSLIEDAIVVYRLVRAPERLVFNVDVGNMAPPKAEAYLKKLMHSYWSRKTYDNAQGGTINAFDPQSMLDAFWFAKRAGSEGTSVDQLAGGANLGELTDLMYFVKKLYKSLRVPANRLEPDSNYQDDTSVLREELKFAKFIIRLQHQFTLGLKEAFITQLKLKGIWKSYKLKENDIEMTFNPPSSFHALREQQIFDLKSSNYNNLATGEFVSNTFAQKKYLGWEDPEIKQNREWLRKDKALAFELAQIETMGPNWEEIAAAQAEGQAMAAGGMGDTGGALPPPEGAPPEFGPGPETGGEPAEPIDAGAGEVETALPD
ncbi:MAG: hypothetical protein CL816_01660 [Coxiellaceae bacterium]|nr:hypothetical protein [Coxiellaceae bacterium]